MGNAQTGKSSKENELTAREPDVAPSRRPRLTTSTTLLIRHSTEPVVTL